MKVSHILCAILACAPLTFEARATASSEDGRPSRPAASEGPAAGRAAPSRDASATPEGTHSREPAQAGARAGGGSRGSGSKGREAAVSPRGSSGTPQRNAARGGVAQTGRSNADRLHSLLNAKAPGRLAHQPGRPVGSTHAPQGVGSAGQPKLAASNGAAPAAPKLTASPRLTPAPRLAVTPRNVTIGGPHGPGVGRVGGPAVSRTTHSATIDGAQLRHKS
jgi:hypothetical protein